MPKYVDKKSLRDAVQRLQSSRAHTRFVDFLIIKRALVLDASGTVTLSSKDPHLLQAIFELMARDPLPEDVINTELQGEPFVNIFGSGRRKGYDPYRTPKYITNGTADTVSGPGWRGVIDIRSTGPRVVALQQNYHDELEKLMLVRRSGTKPRLSDAAAWYFRFTDVDERLQTEPEAELVVDAFVSDLSLDQEEIALLFDEGELEAETT